MGALTGGLAAAFLLLTTGWRAGAWVVAAAIPLLLRLAQDQGAWGLAAYLEQETRPGPRQSVVEVTASAIAASPPALAMGAGVGAAVGVRLGVAMGVALVVSSAAATAVGLLLPAALAAARRGSLLRQGRLVPLAAALTGFVLYVALLGAVR